MTALRLGTLIMPADAWPTAQEAWRSAEALGFDVGYTADHLTHSTMVGRWWADGWTTLGAAAQVTTRMDLGTLVASAAVRRPAALARAAATLQDLSGGRFVLGLGAGTAPDAVVDGQEAPTPSELGGRLASTVATVRALWRGEDPDLGVTMAPLPPGVAAPHLLLAAHGPRAMRLVAEHADGWSTYGGPAAAGLGGDELWALLAEQSRQVSAACEEAGRDPATLRRSVLLGYGPDRPLASVDSFTATVERAVGTGFDEVVVYWPQGEPGDRFWADPSVVGDAVAAVR